jgi:tripeptide aminopeptidase
MASLLDRFCRYVQVETTAVEDTDQYPSSPGQRELAELLASELHALGLEHVDVSEHAIVMATVPATVEGAPTIAWLAHMDTSPEASGRGVKPTVHENYAGGDIPLPGNPDKVITVADTPALAELVGKTLITTDGTTLLGADDKAGVAVIMTAVETLMQDQSIEHGPIRVVFTCDEEVGRGTDKLDIAKIDAACGYTLDGEGAGGLENETFSADLATITVQGVNIHPGLACGKMVNAIRVVGDFLASLPAELSPERTKEREPFVHPYVLEGGVAKCTVKILLRSFATDDLATQAELLKKTAADVMGRHAGAQIDVAIRKQYRNMLEHLQHEPRAVKLAQQAFENVGLTPKFEAIRGGTDGSRLSERGLPTPNLSTGMHNFHSELEFACLEEMEAAVEVLVELAKLWGKERA